MTGRDLKKLLIDADITQEELACRIGVKRVILNAMINAWGGTEALSPELERRCLAALSGETEAVAA